jgi:plastocyanin
MAKSFRPHDDASRLPRSGGLVPTVGLVLLIMIGVAGCAGGGSSGDPSRDISAAQGSTSTSPPGACGPDGTTLKITARDNRFDRQCLAGPAGTPLTVTFANLDRGVVHNLAIYRDAQLSGALFKGKLVQGVTTVVYKVPALPAGSYYFQCDVHPQTMNGTFVVR